MSPILGAREQLFKDLARVRRRWFVGVWSGIVAKGSLATLAITGAAVGLGAAWHPAGPGLVVLVACAALLSVAALAATAWRWRHRPSDRQVARFVEERMPDLEERLISALDVLSQGEPAPGSPGSHVVSEAARRLAAVDPDLVIPATRLRRQVLAATLALGAAAVSVWMLHPWVDRAWQVARATWWPASLALIVEPGDTVVVEGSEIRLQVQVAGIDPDLWSTPVTVVATASHLAEPVPLAREAGHFSGVLDAGRSGFTYRVVSGPLASQPFTVEVRRHPRIERLDLVYEYPRYTGLPRRVEEAAGDIFAPPGTTVTVRVHTSEPVDTGQLVLARQGRVPLETRSATLLEGRLRIDGDDAYRVRVRDGHGLEAESDVEYFVRAMDDRPPDVRILRPGGDARVTRLQEVVVEARADDDYGIARFELVYAPRGEGERVVPLATSGGTSVTGRHTVYLEDLDVRPGDFVTYYARARDVARGKRSTETRSDIFFLEVRPFNEEFEAAQTQAGQAGGDGSFDDLARLQKDIIVATWRLDRRSGAGVSTRDVEAIARAQGDLRRRTEQLARQMAPGGGIGARVPLPVPPGPRPASPASPGTALQRATAAMARAQEALEAIDVSRALPHENEALNEILRAQAEQRRQQVARQLARGGAGGGRSGNQDLSALFDRELQRQQQTIYEERATPQQRRQQNAAEEETLRRLRELAARQDELGRQQQDLARRRAQLPAEEVRRRLQRLTREQEDLRRDAERLARQLDTQLRGQAGGSSSSREPGAEGDARDTGVPRGEQTEQVERARRLRDAAQEMAGAAGALQRESVDSAAARADRALEQLRAAERSLAGTMPDERRRRAGDLQLQARELADAERRIARDARAVSSPEALRALAARQAQLAERARAFERGARDLAAGATPGADDDRVRRVARDVSGGQLAVRMQSSAEAAEAAARGSGAGEAARQLAEAATTLAGMLDRAADDLARAGGLDAEAQRLADTLAQTRRLREQLDAMGRPERSTRSAEARAGDGQTPGATEQGGMSPTGERARGEAEASSSTGTGGRGTAGGEITRLRDDLLRLLRDRRSLVDGLQRDDPSFAQAMATLEGWAPSRSAPGTEPWKQDFARWDELRRRVSLAVEAYESKVTARLAAREARGRLDAGADERPPEEWRAAVAEYFRAVASAPRP